MASLFSQEFPLKIIQSDDAASTASGASSDPASLPTSPDMSVPASSPPALVASLAEASSSPETRSFESLKDLPSVGSLGHFAGLCSRCCFHGKGRCQNGYDCRFCHFDHEKRQRKKKLMNARGYPAAPIHQPLENRGFHNEAWRSTCQLPQCNNYMSGPPGLECNLPSPSPPFSPAVALPAPVFPVPASPATIGGFAAETLKSEVLTFDPVPAKDWSVDKVLNWLTSTGLGHISKNFEEHRITGDVLLELDAADLEEIGVRAVGDKKRLLRAMAQLRTPGLQAPCPPPPTPAPCWQAPMLETTSPWGACPPPPLTAPPSFDAHFM